MGESTKCLAIEGKISYLQAQVNVVESLLQPSEIANSLLVLASADAFQRKRQMLLIPSRTTATGDGSADHQ